MMAIIRFLLPLVACAITASTAHGNPITRRVFVEQKTATFDEADGPIPTAEEVEAAMAAFVEHFGAANNPDQDAVVVAVRVIVDTERRNLRSLRSFDPRYLVFNDYQCNGCPPPEGYNHRTRQLTAQMHGPSPGAVASAAAARAKRHLATTTSTDGMDEETKAKIQLAIKILMIGTPQPLDAGMAATVDAANDQVAYDDLLDLRRHAAKTLADSQAAIADLEAELATAPADPAPIQAQIDALQATVDAAQTKLASIDNALQIASDVVEANHAAGLDPSTLGSEMVAVMSVAEEKNMATAGDRLLL